MDDARRNREKQLFPSPTRRARANSNFSESSLRTCKTRTNFHSNLQIICCRASIPTNLSGWCHRVGVQQKRENVVNGWRAHILHLQINADELREKLNSTPARHTAVFKLCNIIIQGFSSEFWNCGGSSEEKCTLSYLSLDEIHCSSARQSICRVVIWNEKKKKKWSADSFDNRHGASLHNQRCTLKRLNIQVDVFFNVSLHSLLD